MIPACLFFMNLWFFREPINAVEQTAPLQPRVDVLIPARNEAANIGAVIASVLANEGISLSVFVYDDNSTDGTAELVQQIAVADARVHLLHGSALPEGWNGKQHACWRLAEASTAPLLLFLDADVRLERTAIARCVAEQQRTSVPLLSGFPRIVMVTAVEWLLLPLIQFVLLGLLPMFRMRKTTKPAYAAGCGQFMLAEREAYFACEGHAAIRNTRHDGLKLPHLFREHKLRTDICDLTQLAHVRMYRSACEVWSGLSKNSTEGLGSPGRIVPITFLLLMGQVLPTVFLMWACAELLAALSLTMHHALIVGVNASGVRCVLMLVAALCASFLPSFLAVLRFKHPLRSAFFHPMGVLLLLVLQWYALVRQIVGKPVGWRARSYSSSTGEQIG